MATKTIRLLVLGFVLSSFLVGLSSCQAEGSASQAYEEETQQTDNSAPETTSSVGEVPVRETPPPPPPPPPPLSPPPAKPTSKPKAAAPKPASQQKHVLTWEGGLAKLNTIELRVGDVDVAEQTRHLAKTFPSMLAYIVANHVLKYIMRVQLKITKFPHTLVGMVLLFSSLFFSEDGDADKVISFMEPATTLLTNFLPCFFVPALIITPLAASTITAKDAGLFLGVITFSLPIVLGFTGHLVQFLQRLSGQKVAKSAAKPADSSSGFKTWFSDKVEKVFAVATVGSGALALALPDTFTHPFYAITTFYAFIFASRIPRYFNPTVRQFWHPLLTTYSWASLVLLAFSSLSGRSFFSVLKQYFVGGGSPFHAAGNFVMFWLEPSIISFAFGLYARRKQLMENFMPIIVGSFLSTVFGIFTMAGLNRLFNPARELKMALLPRATAALAVVQAATIGASTSLTTVNCCVSGIMGANFAGKFSSLFGLTDPVARGMATGCSGLALASSAMAQSDPAAFPFGALGMALTSTWSTILYSIPAFTKLVISLTGQPAPNPAVAAATAATKSTSPAILRVLSRIAKVF